MKLGFWSGWGKPVALVTLLSGGDTTAPTVTITCAQTGPTATTPLNFTFTLSEASTNFAVGDITVGGVGGTKSNFAGSGTSYTCDIAPTSSGTMTVDVAGGAFTDAAGNGNTAATQFSIVAIVFAFLDNFLTLDAAPVATPRTCEPGPGTLTLVQTDGEYAIDINGLTFPAQATAVWGDQYAVDGEITRAGGMAIGTQLTLGAADKDFWTGFNNDATPAASAVAGVFGWRTGSTLIAASNNEAYFYSTYSASTSYKLAVVLRSAGAFYFIKGGAFAEWTLYAVGASGTGNVYPAISNLDQSGTVRSIKAAVLPGNLATDYNIATNRTASASAGAEITHVANGIIEATWVAAAGATYELEVRRSDATHRWIIRGSQAGSTVKLIEDNAGETERATAAQTFTDSVSYRFLIVATGNSIYVHVNGARKLVYTSAAFNNTATIAKTSHAVTNFIAWPIALAASEVAVLDAFFPDLGEYELGTIAVSGDSKSNATYDWWTEFLSNISADTGLTWTKPYGSSYGGGGVAELLAGLQSSPPAASPVVSWVMLNIGVNNVTDTDIISQADFETAYAAILDIFHSTWPNAQVRCMRIWKRTDGHPLWPAQIAAIDNTYIPNVLASRSAWAAIGPDERVWMENGDNGTTLTDDGIHPNAAGRVVAAAQWQTTTGY